MLEVESEVRVWMSTSGGGKTQCCGLQGDFSNNRRKKIGRSSLWNLVILGGQSESLALHDIQKYFDFSMSMIRQSLKIGVESAIIADTQTGPK